MSPRFAAPVLALVVAVLGVPAIARADAPGTYPVGVTQRTFVDDTRPTAANRDCAEIPSRTLPTTIYYPALGPANGDGAADASPATGRGPFPLVLFAHGYSATPEHYDALLRQWASAGYVIAAPTFPLSSGRSPCGAIAGDVVNQPEDMSFVIDEVLGASRRDAVLKGMVDKRAVGAAGHSNGAITVYGLVANTKLRDPRVKAAAVLAGTPQKYPKGAYDFTKAPPVLIVHGTDDSLVSYANAEDAFNAARGPKGLLTIEAGSHGAPTAAEAYAATTDFFEAYLRGDEAAAARLPADQVAGVSRMTFEDEPGATTTIPTEPRVFRNLQATVTPAKRLTNGQTVTVTWSGYTPGKAVSILQCHGGNRDLSNSSACDYANAKLLQPNPTGDGSVTMTVVTGAVGDGFCGARNLGCFIVVNNESSTDPRNSVLLDISFAKEG